MEDYVMYVYILACLNKRICVDLNCRILPI